ncbi:hypothetical protein C8Q80DRAFT_1183017 [Daedaleopsis nitida]|nr:hypothetical protein C8Q80DRAFT_1183017 [Daedaleopsis nitida]
MPYLPFELIHSIVTSADNPTLCALSLVNHALREAATACLYRALHLRRPSSAVKCLQTLKRAPELAYHVRALSMMFQRETDLNFTESFLALLGCALHNTSQLVSLELDVYGSLGRHLRGCSFRLTNLHIACDWDVDLMDWLNEQSALRIFVFNGLPNPQVQLAITSLPNLRRIVGVPSVVSLVVPGRPVQQVFISCVVHHAIHRETIETLAQACKSSTGPVRVVHVLYKIQHHRSAEDLFQGLSPLPSYLPQLAKFSMLTYSSVVDKHFCEALGNFIGKFGQLESVYIDTGQLDELVEENDGLRQLAVALGDHCPTLRAVRLSDAFYAYRAPREWVSLLDVVEMFEQHRDAAMDFVTGKTIPDAADISRVLHDSPREESRASPPISEALGEISRRNGILRGGDGGPGIPDLEMMSPEHDTNIASLINLVYQMSSVVIAGIINAHHRPSVLEPSENSKDVDCT